MKKYDYSKKYVEYMNVCEEEFQIRVEYSPGNNWCYYRLRLKKSEKYLEGYELDTYLKYWKEAWEKCNTTEDYSEDITSHRNFHIQIYGGSHITLCNTHGKVASDEDMRKLEEAINYAKSKMLYIEKFFIGF